MLVFLIVAVATMLVTHSIASRTTGRAVLAYLAGFALGFVGSFVALFVIEATTHQVTNFIGAGVGGAFIGPWAGLMWARNQKKSR